MEESQRQVKELTWQVNELTWKIKEADKPKQVVDLYLFLFLFFAQPQLRLIYSVTFVKKKKTINKSADLTRQVKKLTSSQLHKNK